MKIVVIGGTGLIGSRLVNKLQVYGHEALAASPKSGVNSVTGDGLADVLALIRKRRFLISCRSGLYGLS